MDSFTDSLRRFWLWMVVPPWHNDERRGTYAHAYHWVFWLIGWTWALAGLVGGALVAPSLIQFWGLSGIPYQDELVIGVAVAAGFLVQLLGWCYVAVITASLVTFLPRLAVRAIRYEVAGPQAIWMPSTVFAPRRIVYYGILGILPLAGVGYTLYRYFTWVGAGQRSVTIAFAGGLLVKAFVIPAVWGAIKSKAFQIFIDWLHGGKTKSA